MKYIETDRLVLRPFESDDLAYMQIYATRPEFWKYLPIDVQSNETVRLFFEKIIREKDLSSNLRFNLAIHPKSIGHIVGTIRCEMKDTKNFQCDLGFALDSKFQRRGYMTEAVNCMLEFAFLDLNAHRVWATADIENIRSWRVMERVGMRREGKMRQDKLVRGEWRDSFLYSIIKPDFEGL